MTRPSRKSPPVAEPVVETPRRARVTREWTVAPGDPDRARALAALLGIHPVAAGILVGRGYGDADRARAFLRPDLNGLLPPADLPNIERAVARVNRALRDNEKIVIWGDYDVDGLTSATILVNLFRFLGRSVGEGGQILYYVPHRVEEGYGLSIPAIEQLARDGVKLMITCDCGTCDRAEITRAAELGIDVVVTDHHEPDAELPPAYAIVNPKLPGSRYAFPGICGAGIAFKFAWAMGQGLSQGARVSDEFRNFLLDSMALVALGTVADVAPLADENRILVSYGLIALRDTLRHDRSPGLRALLENAGLDDRSPVTPTHVGFRIAPLLNACGRMHHAKLGFDLLTSRDRSHITDLVAQIEKLNRQRQECGKEILQDARRKITEEVDLERDRVIVLASEKWHSGVVGIVASKLVEEFHRPAILIGFMGPDGGFGRGSARTVPEFNIHEALTACSHTMVSFGGHAMAGGMKIRADRVDDLRRALHEYAEKNGTGADRAPRLAIDAEIGIEGINRELANQLELLAPHGVGNPKPIFATRGLKVAGEPKLMGKTRDHLSFMVTNGTTSFKAVAFGMADSFPMVAQARTTGLRLAYTIDVNAWMGRETVEFMVKDIQPEA